MALVLPVERLLELADLGAHPRPRHLRQYFRIPFTGDQRTHHLPEAGPAERAKATDRVQEPGPVASTVRWPKRSPDAPAVNMTTTPTQQRCRSIYAPAPQMAVSPARLPGIGAEHRRSAPPPPARSTAPTHSPQHRWNGSNLSQLRWGRTILRDAGPGSPPPVHVVHPAATGPDEPPPRTRDQTIDAVSAEGKPPITTGNRHPWLAVACVRSLVPGTVDGRPSRFVIKPAI